jgi:hypothetical protein
MDPALEVWIRTVPLVEADPYPLIITTLPPFKLLESPELRMSSPPAPLFPEPTVT